MAKILVVGTVQARERLVQDLLSKDKEVIKSFTQNNKVRTAFALSNGRDVKITNKIIINNIKVELSQLKDSNINSKAII